MFTFSQYLLNEMYIALVLDDQTRTKLRDTFPPKYKDFIGHHITLKFGVHKDTPLPRNQHSTEVVGYADDGKGIEALVVSLDGKTQRSDGSTYHITWSLDRSKGYKPVDSNKLLTGGFKKLDNPINITVKTELLK
jgi:hypothetical protein